MNKRTILILLVVLSVMSTIIFVLYHFYEKKDVIALEPFVFNLTVEEQDEYKRMAINEGDFDAYNEISDFYTLNLKHDELFLYSFLMANKHNDPNAYFDLYILLTIPLEKNGIEMLSMDEITQSFALYFLLKSYELGKLNAISAVKQEFGEGDNISPSSYYLHKIAGNTKAFR